jgi:DNA-binding MarR family transcriptional regulator
LDASDDATNRLHRALASTVRAGMLRLLARQPQSVSDVARASRLSVSMASRHLAILAAAGLLVRERNGNCVEHRVTPAGTAALGDWTGEAGEPSSLTPVNAQARDAADLTDLLQDDVDFVVTHGLGALAAGLYERDRWIERLTQDLGSEWRGRLPTVWEAAMRLYRGDSLQGLPLPPGLVADPPAPPTVRQDMLARVQEEDDP